MLSAFDWSVPWLLLPTVLVGCAAASAATNESIAAVPPCNNKCQFHDETSDCWESAQTYFFHQFVKGINDYVSFEILIKHWNEKHHNKFNLTNKEVMTTLLKESLTTMSGPLTEDDFIPILEILINKTEKYSEEGSYDISCPIPCDYISTLWMYLFICACIVILLIIPMMLLHIYFYRRSFLKYQLT